MIGDAKEIEKKPKNDIGGPEAEKKTPERKKHARERSRKRDEMRRETPAESSTERGRTNCSIYKNLARHAQFVLARAIGRIIDRQSSHKRLVQQRLVGLKEPIRSNVQK